MKKKLIFLLILIGWIVFNGALIHEYWSTPGGKTLTWTIYYPENMTRDDDFKIVGAKEVSMEEFRVLSANFPKIMKIERWSNSDLMVTYFGGSNKYFPIIKATQKLNAPENIFLSYLGTKVSPGDKSDDGILRADWKKGNAYQLWLMLIFSTFFSWLVVGDKKASKKIEEEGVHC